MKYNILYLLKPFNPVYLSYLLIWFQKMLRATKIQSYPDEGDSSSFGILVSNYMARQPR
jgi:hypothetical protein